MMNLAALAASGSLEDLFPAAAAASAAVVEPAVVDGSAVAKSAVAAELAGPGFVAGVSLIGPDVVGNLMVEPEAAHTVPAVVSDGHPGFVSVVVLIEPDILENLTADLESAQPVALAVFVAVAMPTACCQAQSAAAEVAPAGPANHSAVFPHSWMQV